MDSPLYVRMAEWLRGGAPAEGPAHHGYSALVALAGLLAPGREWPGRLVSLAASLALVAIVWALARRTAPRWASLAACLAALHPVLGVYGVAVMTEASFLAIAYGALLLIEHRRLLAGGLALGAGYAVRPEALVLAAAAAALTRLGRRGAVLLVAGFLLAAGPYVAFLSLREGGFTLSPKTVLVHGGPRGTRETEWRVGPVINAAAAPRSVRQADPRVSADTITPAAPRGLVARTRSAALSLAADYLPNLGRHATRLLEAWPLPLLALSLIGLARRRGVLLAPFAVTLALPLLVVPDDIRFALLQVPALAVAAAEGAAWLAAGVRRPARATGAAMALALAAGGLALGWAGPAGRVALSFDDGPMPALRAAGAWLAEHGRPGATVMDRKAYVPFFAGMRHAQLPDDSYDTIVAWARRSGADYLVVEEYVARTLRPQLAPLIGDARFRAAERRLRPIYARRDAPGEGVAIFEVVRDSSAAPGP